jgi:hypothetical protein
VAIVMAPNAAAGHPPSVVLKTDCQAYVWEIPGTYATVQLGGSGDMRVINTSLEGQELDEWLRYDLGLAQRD